MNTNTDSNVNLDLIMDVELPIAVRFGQTTMLLEDILKLGHGSVIELEKLLGGHLVLHDVGQIYF